MRSFLQTITTAALSVGVTFTSGGLRSFASMGSGAPEWFTSLVTISDGIPVTYYPLQANFSVSSVGRAVLDINSTVTALQSLGHCVLFQELGCPSGFMNSSSVDGSSGALQAAFFNASLTLLLDAASSGIAQVAGVAVLSLVDWSPASCAYYQQYYRITSLAFLEYLCTLGLMTGDGLAKPALQVLQNFVSRAPPLRP
jgi:hypothetical protein